MLNKSGVESELVLDIAQILLDVDNAVSIPCVVPQKLGTHVDKYTVVKAGTPIVLNLLDTEKIAKPVGEYEYDLDAGGESITPARWIAIYSPTLDLQVEPDKCYQWMVDNCTEQEFNYMWTMFKFDSDGREAYLKTRNDTRYWYDKAQLENDFGIKVLSGNTTNAKIYCPFFNYMLNPFFKDMTSVDNLKFTDVSKYLRVIVSGYLGRVIEEENSLFDEMTFTKLSDETAEIKRNGVPVIGTYNFDTVVNDMGFTYIGNFAVGDTIVARLINGDLPPKTKMNAILLNDVNVTEEDGNGTALIFGSVNTNRVSSIVRDALIEAAKDYNGHSLKCVAL
ncbi:MAG: hypothetical protein MJ168_08045 [Clostridia bacterium]|nr:hypothetical protein [Clostridia bacterium]